MLTSTTTRKVWTFRVNDDDGQNKILGILPSEPKTTGHYVVVTIGGSRGRAGRTPPMGPNSFVYAHIFTEKHPRWSSTPPLMGACLPTGNPGSITGHQGKIICINKIRNK